MGFSILHTLNIKGKVEPGTGIFNIRQDKQVELVLLAFALALYRREASLARLDGNGMASISVSLQYTAAAAAAALH